MTFTFQHIFDCRQPVALVTGSGAARVGRVVAAHLAELGCRMVLHGNRHGEEAEKAVGRLRQSGREAIAVVADLQDESAVGVMFDRIDESFGRIDVLVNAAAIWEPRPLEQVTAAELHRYFAVNAVGSFLAAKAAGLRMAGQPSGGSIVNIGDWATVRPYLDHAAYFPSKGSVETMTRSLAVELGRRNRRVRVNCVQPGPVLLADDIDSDKRQKIAAGLLLGRVGTPEHIAHAVQFLCENDFVTGVCLPVDGGRTIFADDGLQDGLNTG